MGENLVDKMELELPDPPETGNVLVDRTVAWVRTNYNDLVKLCEDNDIPKPPPW